MRSNFRCVVMISQCLAVAALGAQPPSSAPFLSGVGVGGNVVDVKIADAVLRSDGRWLTFGSHVTSDPGGRETALLVVRDADGAPMDARELVIDGALSYRPMSLVTTGTSGDVVMLGIEYDTTGNRHLSLTRIDTSLSVVWSTRLATNAGIFEWARLVAPASSGEELLLIGEVRRFVNGMLDNGDALLAAVQPDGTVSAVRTLGTARDHERIVDAHVVGSDGSMLLLVETARLSEPGAAEWGDGLVLLDGGGSIANARLTGHATAPGIRAGALRLLPHADGGWVVAGRRTAFGPNVFYVHKVNGALEPEPSRTLIPFFNVMDMDVRDGNVWIYGEANGEIMDTGTVLIGLDSTLQMFVQRRYATENTVFPTGAFEFSATGALLALGARRGGDELFVYDLGHHVALPTAEGVLCEEGDYTGFSTVSDPITPLTGWQPAATPFELLTTAVSATTAALPASKVELCTRQ
jgi:hypothetical protein